MHGFVTLLHHYHSSGLEVGNFLDCLSDICIHAIYIIQNSRFACFAYKITHRHAVIYQLQKLRALDMYRPAC